MFFNLDRRPLYGGRRQCEGHNAKLPTGGNGLETMVDEEADIATAPVLGEGERRRKGRR